MSTPDGYFQKGFSLERWQNFWERSPVERPLLGVALEMPSAALMIRSGDDLVSPVHLDVEQYLEVCDRFADKASQIASDAVWAASAFQGFPWMEAILGCPIHCSGGTMWAEPLTENLEEMLAQWSANPWFALFLDVTERMAKHVQGRYPVGLPVLRGPADILAALLGPSRFCLDLYDAPTELKNRLAVCTTAFLEIAQTLLAILNRYQQRYVQASRQVWAPDLCLETQEDVAALISAKQYRNFILPIDRQLWRLTSYSIRHLHSTALHYIADLLADNDLRAIQITLDDGGPSLSQVCSRVRQVQEAEKPVILHGSLTSDAMVELVHSLAPVGLYIAARAYTMEEANAFAAAVNDKLSN